MPNNTSRRRRSETTIPVPNQTLSEVAAEWFAELARVRAEQLNACAHEAHTGASTTTHTSEDK